jgi:hypothetical protein
MGTGNGGVRLRALARLAELMTVVIQRVGESLTFLQGFHPMAGDEELASLPYNGK